MLPSELQALREKKIAAFMERESAQGVFIGLARAIAQDWRRGVAPATFALDLLNALEADYAHAVDEADRAAWAVVHAHDAEVGRVTQ